VCVPKQKIKVKKSEKYTQKSAFNQSKRKENIRNSIVIFLKQSEKTRKILFGALTAAMLPIVTLKRF
jgi:hypothetical protein